MFASLSFSSSLPFAALLPPVVGREAKTCQHVAHDVCGHARTCVVTEHMTQTKQGSTQPNIHHSKG